jgi:hypothetical protein
MHYYYITTEIDRFIIINNNQPKTMLLGWVKALRLSSELLLGTSRPAARTKEIDPEVLPVYDMVSTSAAGLEKESQHE